MEKSEAPEPSSITVSLLFDNIFGHISPQLSCAEGQTRGRLLSTFFFFLNCSVFFFFFKSVYI